MSKIGPDLDQDWTTKRKGKLTVPHDGRTYFLSLAKEGWRLRRRTATETIDFRTGTANQREAVARARAFLEKRQANPLVSRKGGGTLAALVALYLAKDAPRKCGQDAADINVSRLRTVCRVALGKELDAVTCKEVGPGLWMKFLQLSLANRGFRFSLTDRHRENIGINSAIRCAKSIFLPHLVRHYSEAGLTVNRDAQEAVFLAVPHVPPSKVDDAALVAAWASLRKTDLRLWLVIGLARFAGLRREEIACVRGGWIVERKGAVIVDMRDRPEEGWFSKTGKPYSSEVIHDALAKYLLAQKPDALIVPAPESGDDRARWFERVPQAWLRERGIRAQKPLHRLRGMYAAQVADDAENAVLARNAGVKAAQKALGHASPKTTEDHYLSL